MLCVQTVTNWLEGLECAAVNDMFQQVWPYSTGVESSVRTLVFSTSGQSRQIRPIAAFVHNTAWVKVLPSHPSTPPALVIHRTIRVSQRSERAA